MQQAEQAAEPTAAPAAPAAATEQTTPPTETTQTTTETGTEKPATIAAGGETQTQVEKPYWPADWREKAAQHIAAGDKDIYKRELKRLERIADPAGVYGMYREAESKLTSGTLIKKPGKNAKPEEIAEFHKALGVPEKPDDYLKEVKLENGAVIGDADKPMVSEFVGAMHKAGAPKEVVSEALNWYYKNQEAQATALDEADDTFRVESEKVLKEEYGPAFKRKSNAIATLFKTAPGGADVNNEGALFARLMGGRTADGRIIGNDPDMVRWLVSLAQDVNPAATVVEDGTGTAASIDVELEKIQKLRTEDKRKYFSDEIQAREQDLIARREKIRARAR